MAQRPEHQAEDTVREVADRYVAALAELDPAAARAIGREPASVLPRWDPATLQATRDLAARTVDELSAAGAAEHGDELLRSAMAERLGSDVALHDCGFTPGLVAPLATPVHHVLHQLQVAGQEQVAEVFAAVPGALEEIRASLEDAAARGYVVATRQSRVLAGQMRRWTDTGGDDDLGLAGERLGDQPRRRALIELARRSMVEHAQWLEEVHAARGGQRDAVGAERYAVTSSAFLGAPIDPAETYAYGWERLAELTATGTALARRLGQSTIAEAEVALDADPEGRVVVGEPLVHWIEERIDATREQLAGRIFDWPDSPLGRIEGHLAAPGSGAIFYSPPDPAGTRPARVVWSTPLGEADVPVWREVSTVHHEGIPGHHLQHVVTMTQDRLHPWQRHLCHVHGYAEGWAHYTEGRADHWGLLRDDGERLAVILAQRWRAARIVVDLGLHLGEELGLQIPQDNGFTQAGAWSPAVGREVLVSAAGMDPGTAAFEVDRYLGWPGQALAFCVGARLWEQARADGLAETASDDAERAWHATALALGPMGLGPLATALGR